MTRRSRWDESLPVLTEDTDARVRRTQIDTDGGSHCDECVRSCLFVLECNVCARENSGKENERGGGVSGGRV